MTAASDAELLETSEYSLAMVRGKNESEFEDLIDPSIYIDELATHFGVSLKPAEIMRGKEKWSQRLRILLQAKGKAGSKAELLKAKEIVVLAIETSTGDPFELRHGRPVISTLIQQLDSRLG